MRILIATASRHGSTRELGQWLGSSLTARLADTATAATVDVRDAAEVDSIAEYDAVVLGSGVYMGRWLGDARSLVAREQSELETRPVWLFSSGPIGSGTPPTAKSKWSEASWAIEHKVFGGKLDRSTLSLFERAVVRMINAGDGDDRSRAEVDEWAGDIIGVLTKRLSPSTSAVDKSSSPEKGPSS
ncbi:MULTISPECIES: flavodoxin domain-containing protein [unclassified Rhodococcus (in: high G+C Gram-positive bacteria)]|uniref:flavodoxin domain-containing protein n=1 Tax=unclassified Rhodococcus (in: high G+C Gram-positive bacteria) TaxID=192944 RepID=UPI0009EF0E61|nr:MULTISPECIES: flavodoxin domain-containing protein [unclassified Rhodococcus (in: high G+C Gram-positive bacteria)]KAA0923520.1 protoporphyrinogen oxidase [Rhodococcus sp. ANT_H53B]